MLNPNAKCCICGKAYHVCNSCKEIKEFTPWRTVTDTIDHYMIYLAIHGYSVTKNKKKALEELKKCDLSDFDSFNPYIKKILNEILNGEKKEKSVKKATKVVMDDTKIKQEVSPDNDNEQADDSTDNEKNSDVVENAVTENNVE